MAVMRCATKGLHGMRGIALGLATLMLTTGAVVEGQFINGGEVSVTCTSCSCEGASDAGTIVVLDNPSTGIRMASVDGMFSEITQTSCGTSAFAAGDRIYELRGIDLIPREFEAVDMLADADCAPFLGGGDCYRGDVDKDLSEGLLLSLGLCACMDPGQAVDTTTVQVRTIATVLGASEVFITGLEVCLDGGFISNLLTVTVEDTDYFYNFDLVVPGRNGSSTLQVASPPDASAQAFVCEEDATAAPSSSLTAAPSSSPTPSMATSPPLPPPTAGPPALATPPPVAAGVPESTPATAAPEAIVEDQFIDGGEVSVTCTSCSCEGTSDAGAIMVLDNPSSGNRVVSVDGEYSDIVEASCGVSAFVSGSTVYELSGIDLVPRELAVVDMSADQNCADNSTPPADSDCYSGSIVEGLDAGLSITISLCVCIQPEDPGSPSLYSSQADVTLVGASDVSLPDGELELCLDAGFFSQLLAVTVEDDTYFYNFDLVIPGESSSSTLQVAPAPEAPVLAFVCGEEATEAETSSATPSPIAAITTAPGVSPQEDRETGTASASTTGCACDTSGASSSLSTGRGGGGGGGSSAGAVTVAAVLGSAWLASFFFTATYNSS